MNKAALAQQPMPVRHPRSTGFTTVLSTFGSASPSIGLILQKKSSCVCGGGCPACQAKSSDLKISQPNDPAEVEADRIADEVMRMPVHEAKPAEATSNSPTNIHRKYDAFQAEDEMPVQRKPLPSASSPSSGSPDHVRSDLDSGGIPLDHQTRSFFEPRLGYDLSPVRIHADSTAGQSARAIDARAYTLGSNIVFGSGEYKPESESGKHLLAHELAHVVQQGTGISPMMIHRVCPSPSGLGNTSPGGACRQSNALFVHGRRLKFCPDTAALMDGQAGLVTAVIADARRATSITLHGNASVEGPSANYNFHLSCHRAIAISTLLRAAGVTAPITLVSHGPTAVYGPPLENRNVVIQLAGSAPAPVPPTPVPPTRPPAPTPATPTFPSTPQGCTPSTSRRSASGCTPNPGGSGLPDVGGTHTESHGFVACTLTEAQVAASSSWCVDSQQAHGGEVCYREIPTVAGGPGRQFCYSENCCHDSADAVSVVNPASPGAGACCQSAGIGTTLDHIWQDVVPEFIDDPCRVTRDITGLDLCADPDWGTRGHPFPDGTWYDEDGTMHMGPGPKW